MSIAPVEAATWSKLATFDWWVKEAGVVGSYAV
jgi:hypothetical protein